MPMTTPSSTPGRCSTRWTRWSTARWWRCCRSAHAVGEPRYRLLETPRAYALECLDAPASAPALQRRHALAVAALFDAAYEEYFSGRIGVDDWLHHREPDLDNARDALRWARAAGDAEVELRIGTTMLRALPPSLHVERMALADACEARLARDLPEPLQLQAWLELSCVLADTQKARARQAAERALAPGAPAGRAAGRPLRALSRAVPRARAPRRRPAT